MLAIIASGAAASLAFDGADYESVPDLVKALRTAGIACPVFTETEPPRDNSARHGACWTAENELLFDVDMYGSAEDRDKGIASRPDVHIPYCIVFGEQWSVSLAGDANDPDCKAIADRLNGQVVGSFSGGSQ